MLLQRRMAFAVLALVVGAVAVTFVGPKKGGSSVSTDGPAESGRDSSGKARPARKRRKRPKTKKKAVAGV